MPCITGPTLRKAGLGGTIATRSSFRQQYSGDVLTGTSGTLLIQERIMATDYKKRTYGAQQENVNNPVTCGNADVSSSHSATLNVTELHCEENAVISVDHSATLTIAKLICKNAKLNVSYSSLLRIVYIECSGTLDIRDSYSSTIMIAAVGDPRFPERNGSKIGTATGLLQYTSTGVCYASIGIDSVRTESASTWIKL
jgi:hypothetical protein